MIYDHNNERKERTKQEKEKREEEKEEERNVGEPGSRQEEQNSVWVIARDCCGHLQEGVVLPLLGRCRNHLAQVAERGEV